MKHSKVMKKNSSKNAAAPFKRSYSLAPAATKYSHKNDRQTNNKIINSINYSSSTTNPDFTATHHHVEVFKEDTTREMKVKRPPTPPIDPGSPGQHH